MNYNAIYRVKKKNWSNFPIVIPCLKVSRKYHTTSRTAGRDNPNHQTTLREILEDLRSTAVGWGGVGGELHSHATCFTSCLIVTRLQSSKHIRVRMKSARTTRWTFTREAVTARRLETHMVMPKYSSCVYYMTSPSHESLAECCVSSVHPTKRSYRRRK